MGSLLDNTNRQTQKHNMTSTCVKDIPRELLIAESLKTELTTERSLRPTEAGERNTLPSAEDVNLEKSHQSFISGIEEFKADELKRTETKEKIVLPGAEEIQAEKQIQGLLQGVETFENEKLRTVKPREPASPSAILQVELARDSSLTAVSDFDKNKLKKTETSEKNPLPSSNQIAQEKEHVEFKNGIQNFDKTCLSHTETMVKNVLPTQEIITMEKSQ